MVKERVWLVSEVFFPDTDIASANIATEIALKLKEHFEVHVICGPENYARGNLSNPQVNLEGIRIHRWGYFNFDKNHKFKRLIRVIGIALGLLFYGLRIGRSDKAFVISNPAFITPFFAFLKWLKGFEFILLMHDVFPENLVTGNYIKPTNFFYRLSRSVFVLSRKSANKIIVIGRDMKHLLMQDFPASRSSDITIIPNWADTEEVCPKERTTPDNYKEELESTLKNKLVILFAGNHGVLQHLMAFVKIIKQVSNPELFFLFAGGGAVKNELLEYVESQKIKNIAFLPSFPRYQLNEMLSLCDIGLVSLSDTFYGVGVPSKSYNILAAGKPILFLGNTDTEISLFVKENEIGWAFRYSDISQIISFLESLHPEDLPQIKEKGLNGRKIVEDAYAKNIILEKILNTCLTPKF
ncbi:MAG TPA: glycosyltransferase family 4 protein [Niabella sp.]|nr:glycosyltransferase family 4 protein [Niabella sp.]HOZ97372.1 glycosyltransferase family 4 protein [Niabella sp.]HQW15357.1 glycosyltransferase family 4 protein [Niabella sp.]HQX20597.1 glycosyltransferase family 4 protein [Niabella sp.]HQX40982.1 glycosyltransferase family 4 protein [Niabella sp.]